MPDDKRARAAQHADELRLFLDWLGQEGYVVAEMKEDYRVNKDGDEIGYTEFREFGGRHDELLERFYALGEEEVREEQEALRDLPERVEQLTERLASLEQRLVQVPVDTVTEGEVGGVIPAPVPHATSLPVNADALDTTINTAIPSVIDTEAHRMIRRNES